MNLWNSEKPFPVFEELSYAPHTEYRDPHTFSEDGYHFLLGAAVIKHKGILRVSFAHSLRTENDDCTRLEEKLSLDDGKTWTENVIAETENGYGRSHGVYFPHGGRHRRHRPFGRRRHHQMEDDLSPQSAEFQILGRNHRAKAKGPSRRHRQKQRQDPKSPRQRKHRPWQNVVRTYRIEFSRILQ